MFVEPQGAKVAKVFVFFVCRWEPDKRKPPCLRQWDIKTTRTPLAFFARWMGLCS